MCFAQRGNLPKSSPIPNYFFPLFFDFYKIFTKFGMLVKVKLVFANCYNITVFSVDDLKIFLDLILRKVMFDDQFIYDFGKPYKIVNIHIGHFIADSMLEQ